MLVKTAILIPIYPEAMEVKDPVRKETAVYGKLVGALLADISRRSTVAPRITANEQDQMVR